MQDLCAEDDEGIGENHNAGEGDEDVDQRCAQPHPAAAHLFRIQRERQLAGIVGALRVCRVAGAEAMHEPPGLFPEDADVTDVVLCPSAHGADIDRQLQKQGSLAEIVGVLFDGPRRVVG